MREVLSPLSAAKRLAGFRCPPVGKTWLLPPGTQGDLAHGRYSLRLGPRGRQRGRGVRRCRGRPGRVFTEPYLYGDIKGQRQSGQSNYFYSDGLGSTTEVTDDTNAIVAT